jgi:hypothetical protein
MNRTVHEKSALRRAYSSRRSSIFQGAILGRTSSEGSPLSGWLSLCCFFEQTRALGHRRVRQLRTHGTRGGVGCRQIGPATREMTSSPANSPSAGAHAASWSRTATRPSQRHGSSDSTDSHCGMHHSYSPMTHEDELVRWTGIRDPLLEPGVLERLCCRRFDEHDVRKVRHLGFMSDDGT